MNRKVHLNKLTVVLGCFCLFLTAAGAAKGADSVRMGRVSGKIECEDKSKIYGFLCFYRASKGIPDSKKFFRPTADHIFSTTQDGSFEVSLPEGKYYLLAFRRSEKKFGPLMKGDYFMFLVDEKGNPRSFEVKAGERADLGSINTIPYIPFHGLFRDAEVTVMSGVVQDENGRPVKDIYVVAYNQPSMLGRPSYVSRMTDEQGRYELIVNGGGSYYIAARSRRASPPARGDYYGQAGDEAIAIKSGDNLEINIRVKKIQ